MKTTNRIVNEHSYVELLQMAERCQSRKEAIHLIHQADRLRQRALMNVNS